MWATPVEASINSLMRPNQQFGVTREWALRTLREASNEDFGDDVVAWVNWAKENGHLSCDYPTSMGPKVNE